MCSAPALSAASPTASSTDDRSTQARIRDAALVCFAELGFSATTVRAIAARHHVQPWSARDPDLEELCSWTSTGSIRTTLSRLPRCAMRAEPLPSLWRVWREHRRALGIWAAALAALIVFYLAFFPMMGEEMMVAIEGMPEGLMAAMGYQAAGTPEGYTNAVVYRLLWPVLLLVCAVGLRGRVIAGQEEDGSLELDLAAPVGRARLCLERLLACWLLLSMLVAAATFAALTYVFQGLADGAGIELLAALSPFSWFLDPDPLATGLHAASLQQLLLISLVAALLGLWRFGRRDLMT